MELDIATVAGVPTTSASTTVRESSDIIPDFVHILDCAFVISEKLYLDKSLYNVYSMYSRISRDFLDNLQLRNRWSMELSFKIKPS